MINFQNVSYKNMIKIFVKIRILESELKLNLDIKTTNLSTSSDSKFFECPDIINEQIHKSEFITESNKNIETRWM